MQLSLPTSRDFLLVLDSDNNLNRATDGVSAGDNTVSVSFRQGTTRDDNERTTYINRRKFIYDANARQMVEVAELSDNELARIEVALSLTATDLQLPGGASLKFKTEFGVTSVADQQQFNSWWGILPIQWSEAIYDCCTEVNADWGSKSF